MSKQIGTKAHEAYEAQLALYAQNIPPVPESVIDNLVRVAGPALQKAWPTDGNTSDDSTRQGNRRLRRGGRGRGRRDDLLAGAHDLDRWAAARGGRPTDSADR